MRKLFTRCLANCLVLFVLLALPTTSFADEAADLQSLLVTAEKQANTQQYEKAIENLEKAITLGLKIKHANTAKIVADFATLLYQVMGDHVKADVRFQQALQVANQQFEQPHPTHAGILNNAALFYDSLGQYAKAEPLYQRAIRLYEATLGKDHHFLAASLNNLADLYRSTSHYAKAEPLYQRALEICEAKLGKEHLTTAIALNNLALLYKEMGLFTKAESLYQRAIAIREAQLEKDHPLLAKSYSNLAALYFAMKQLKKAEPLLIRAVAVNENTLGKNHLETATSLNNLAALYLVTDQHAKAEPLLVRALAIRETKLGTDHPITATSLGMLGVYYLLTQQFDKAESLLNKALDICQRRLGNDHPHTADLMTFRASMLAAQGNTTEAIVSNEQALQSRRRHIVEILPALAEQDQLHFLHHSHDQQLTNSLSFAWQAKLSPEQRLRLASWLLNGKVLAAETLAQRQLLGRDVTTEAARTILTEWEMVRHQIAKRMLQTDQPTSPKELDALREKERQLAASLATVAGRSQRVEPWCEMDGLQQRLPEQAVLIDIMRVPEHVVKQWKPGPEHYVAFLSFRSSETQIVDLGEAAKIDAAINAVRKELETASKTITQRGEVEAEKALREPLTVLAKFVLAPMRRHLDAKEQWIISPDSNLWLFPWSLLPLDEKTYVIEKHRIQYVVSGRDLLMTPLKQERKTTAPIIVADPDFDLNVKSDAPPSLLRGLSKDFKLGGIRRLPGTAAEAEAIALPLEKFAGKPFIYTERNASTAKVRAVKNPNVLVLSTHGFFLEDEKANVPPHTFLFDNQQRGQVPENPLLRCGLLFAGCNNKLKMQDGDTGVLTGYEIVHCDLRGTKMVVLSACETGLGVVQNGHGIAGLRQAFQLAGAESVVATLWQIPDLQSAQLMVGFFDHLAKGQARSEALQLAQREMIQKRRDRFGAAHPFFWAAYTMTGQDQ